MVDLAACGWSVLSADQAIQHRIAKAEAERGEPRPRHWGCLAVAIIAALLAFFLLFPEDGFPVAGTLAALGIVAAAATQVQRGVVGVGADSIDPWLLPAVAERAGLLFVRDWFEPYGLAGAGAFLLERVPSNARAENLAAISVDEIAVAATYSLERGLTGRVYRVIPGRRERQVPLQSVKEPITLVLPKGGKAAVPSDGVQLRPVDIEGDPCFDAALEVFSTDPAAACAMLGADLRALLTEIAEGGAVRAYFRGGEAFVLAPDPLRSVASPDVRPVEDYARETAEVFRSVLEKLVRLRECMAR
ncbi:hypothetical protein E2493_18490 [Sphingomonas parva]|uniref:DUF3137 domain-containing protein n=1 Tax=Sphingomonas parva TaxID=2555898 RepID=A0A4Y8ZL47_9SPHN|nr:hypothetical protein [Sphingomonas parva]TFI56750.1 hypothetical protein E2493_18490 [Sphingomonas parva]